MEKDRFGNLIFDNKAKGDKARAELIFDVLKQASGTYTEPGKSGKKQPAANNHAKAMIDAGMLPNSEDLQTTEALPVIERMGRFIRHGHRVPIAVIREDELEEVCQNLRVQPLDYKGFEFGPGRGERSREASFLAGKIATLPVPEQ